MKVQLLGICIALIAVSICGAGYAQSNPNPAAIQPGGTYGPASPKMAAPAAGQPSLANTMPSATVAPAPFAAGAGPAMQGGMKAAPGTGQPAHGMSVSGGMAPMPMPMGTAMRSGMMMATDNDFVYVVQNGMIYKFPKADITSTGTSLAAGAGPACNLCGTISYIPGASGQCINVTTCTPCPPEGGAGKVEIRCNPNCAQACPATCPSPTTCPTGCVAACPCQQQCDPCGKPCPAPPVESCTTVTTAAGVGAGTCAACPPIGSPSECAQQLVACLQSLSGPEVDKAYLQGLITTNMQVLAVSEASAISLSTTSLQNVATNSVADAGSRINMARRWLKSKFCMDITACPPSSVAGLGVCEILCRTTSAEFDQAFRDKLVQYYIDEIAISQVVLDRACDSQVRAAAARIIREDQERISRLLRCRIC